MRVYIRCKQFLMAYFEKDFIKFFKELEKNNDRDWFKANKPRYEEVVKKTL